MAGAGAGGDTSEPSACEVYCDAVLANCTGKYEQYRSPEQCLEVCKRLPAGTPGDGNVNSVECRTRQARFAESEAFLYCKSAGPLGAGKCGSNCESYCSLMDATCTQERDGRKRRAQLLTAIPKLASRAAPPCPKIRRDPPSIRHRRRSNRRAW